MDTVTEWFTEDEFTKFLEYKKSCNNISRDDIADIEAYISDKTYITMGQLISDRDFPKDISQKSIISKEGSDKKRTIYRFDKDINITLKMIAYKLYKYDHLFSDNCYAFRRNYGVHDAMEKIRHDHSLKQKYCLKVDVKNYFNSIDVPILLNKLLPIKEDDPLLYQVFENILTEPYTQYNDARIQEHRGAMAGIPISSFFANIYLAEVDQYFFAHQVSYYRYSDDIILFAKTMEELLELQTDLYNKLHGLKLQINPQKEKISAPGEVWEFLGFSYKQGEIDLSDTTILKMKHKIKRKAKALIRWQKKKELPAKMAAKGFINTLNHKFYGRERTNCDDVEFTWCRWFFPNLTTHKGLAILDKYIQEYIRYTLTGRHYKGNYRITYKTLKDLGYRNLVYEYYRQKK